MIHMLALFSVLFSRCDGTVQAQTTAAYCMFLLMLSRCMGREI